MRLLRLLIALLAVAGAVISVLALRVHLQDPNAAPPCAVSEHWDCGAVNHSRFAVFPPRSFEEDLNSKGHMPVAVIGIAGYVLILLLALLGRNFLLFEVVQIGFFCALMLTFLEKYVLEKWCIYCVWSQCLLAAMLVLASVNLWLSHRHGAREGLKLRAI
ncbi:MAG: vitamin K epoxide reductase family protein [Janthinobacterium lividum]